MARIVYCIGIILFVLTSCTPTAVREAQATIAMADSLRAKGVSLSDSAALADAVSSLRPWRYLYRDDYARANYYYGRYLRSVGNQPAAMQCFIDATHSHSHDYEILGRVYANMGNMCRFEGNHELAYTIYEQSAQMFKQSGDSTMYYYAINNLALEAVWSAHYETAQQLLNFIESSCSDSAVIVKTYETRAFSCCEMRLYDSTIYYANLLQEKGYRHYSCHTMKAQAFVEANQVDSALHYALLSLQSPCALNDSVNMLYILANHDSSISQDSIRRINITRADTQFAYTRQQENYAHAVEILTQELSRIPNEYSGIIVLCLLLSLLIGVGYIFFQHRRGKLLAFQRKRIATENDILRKQNDTLRHQREEQIHHTSESLQQSQSMLQDMTWRDYNGLCSYMNNQFFMIANKLQSLQLLNEKEVRLCFLVLLGFLSDKQMADILCYSDKTIRSTKRITAKKLGTSSANLREYLIKLALQD